MEISVKQRQQQSTQILANKHKSNSTTNKNNNNNKCSLKGRKLLPVFFSFFLNQNCNFKEIKERKKKESS